MAGSDSDRPDRKAAPQTEADGNGQETKEKTSPGEYPRKDLALIEQQIADARDLPPPPHTSVNVALLPLQRSRLENLDPEIQVEVIRTFKEVDERQFQYASAVLGADDKRHERELADRSQGRKQLIWASCLLGGGLLLVGGTIAVLFIQAGQYQMANTVMIAGISAIGGFLGGTGFGKLLSSTRSAPN